MHAGHQAPNFDHQSMLQGLQLQGLALGHFFQYDGNFEQLLNKWT